MSGEVHECEIQVRMRDLNVGGHVDNVEVARVISEARILFLRFADIGAGPTGLFGAMPPGTKELVAAQAVEYREEMFFSPFEPYLVRNWVSQIGGTSFRLSTEIRTRRDGPAAAVCETVQVLRDAAGQPWQIDVPSRDLLGRFLADPVAMRGF